jgi:hypothetical protein
VTGHSWPRQAQSSAPATGMKTVSRRGRAWINEKRFMEVKETEKRHPETGKIALQVHGGGDFTKQYVRYRAIRVKRLAPAK